MRELRLRALQDNMGPAAHFRPRDIKLSAPLSIVSHLPFPLRIMLQQMSGHGDDDEEGSIEAAIDAAVHHSIIR